MKMQLLPIAFVLLFSFAHPPSPPKLWQHPYASFERGAAKWVTLKTPATLLPGKFYICAVFHPTPRSGVFVDYDASTRNHSQTATPGHPGNRLEQGDWMIRVEIDHPKDHNAIKN